MAYIPIAILVLLCFGSTGVSIPAVFDLRLVAMKW